MLEETRASLSALAREAGASSIEAPGSVGAIAADLPARIERILVISRAT